MSMNDNIKSEKMDIQIYKKMLKIRKFEENLLDLFSHGEIFGTTHTCIGQEGIAVAAMKNIQDGDAVFSNHRCHGHFIAYGGSEKKLLAEIMGKMDGVCAGRGGSQHLYYKHFFSNGIQGGMVPIAAGYALGSKLRGNDDIAVVFIGDGTLGEGIVYETANMIALYEIPLLIIIEDNGYAQSTSKKDNMSGRIDKRFEAFNIESHIVRTNDISELVYFFDKAFQDIRKNKKPLVCIAETYRLAAHSKGDDYRDKREIEQWRKKDPLIINKRYFENRDILSVQEEVNEEIKEAIEYARLSQINKEISYEGIYVLNNFRKNLQENNAEIKREHFSQQLNRALHQIFKESKDAFLLGEDVADPYGGAFKVTKGLSELYRGRVISTPISEAGFAGIANGLALNGYRPIIEIMFGDFATLILDQILNHAAKFSWMYNNKIKTPVLVRLPVGGKRGYGPTHSQCLEKIFMGYPNITVLAPSIFHQVDRIFKQAYYDMNSPVVFVEYKSFYSRYVGDMPAEMEFTVISDGKVYDTLLFYIEKEDADAAIVCYGEALEEAMKASWELMMEEEINVHIICPSYIYPFPYEDVCSMLPKDLFLVVVDNSYEDMGWAEGMAYKIMARNKDRDVEIISADNVYIAASKYMEEVSSPSKEKIKDTILKKKGRL